MNVFANPQSASPFPDPLSVLKNSTETISIVVPVTERCKDLISIYHTHAQVMREKGYSFKFLFVFDGGFIQEGQDLKDEFEYEDSVQIIELPRSFGEATALTIGFERANGKYIICLPSYFQTIPTGIIDVIEALDEGYDLVLTRRWPRSDGFVNKLQNLGFHYVVRKLSDLDFHDLGCGLKGMRGQVAKELQLYGDLHRFIPLLAWQRGFRILEVKVPQHDSDHSVRVYGPGTYLRRLLDILTIVFLFKFTKKPLRFFGLIGSGLFGAGFLISLVMAIEKMLGIASLSDRPLLILGVLLMVLGVQTGSIGLLGEIIIFTHARKVKDYAVEKVMG